MGATPVKPLKDCFERPPLRKSKKFGKIVKYRVLRGEEVLNGKYSTRISFGGSGISIDPRPSRVTKNRFSYEGELMGLEKIKNKLEHANIINN